MKKFRPLLLSITSTYAIQELRMYLGVVRYTKRTHYLRFLSNHNLLKAVEVHFSRLSTRRLGKQILQK